jgi:hypothetical protein
MMMITPLSFCSRGTCKICIIKCESTDDLIECLRIFESDFPASSPIEIPSEIDEVSRGILSFLLEIFIDHLLHDIDEISLPDSAKLEHDISMKFYSISNDFYISVITIFPITDDTSCRARHHSVAELRESLSDRRIEVSIRLSRDIECIREYKSSIIIDFSFSIFIDLIEPVIRDKS